jgi:hypothetical protein
VLTVLFLSAFLPSNFLSFPTIGDDLLDLFTGVCPDGDWAGWSRFWVVFPLFAPPVLLFLFFALLLGLAFPPDLRRFWYVLSHLTFLDVSGVVGSVGLLLFFGSILSPKEARG